MYHIRGKLLGELPADLAGQVKVVATPEVGGLPGLVASSGGGQIPGKDGSFDLPALPPDAYNVTALKTGRPQILLGMVSVSVGNRDVDEVGLRVQLPGELQGHVKVFPEPEGGARKDVPVPSVTVLLEAGDFALGRSRAISNSDGSFVLQNVGAQKYTITVSGLPSKGYVKSVSVNDRTQPESVLDLSRGITGA